MNVTWINLNAAYSHASLALPVLHAACTVRCSKDHTWREVAATPASDPFAVVTAVQATDPDLIAATAYLFTRDQLFRILRRARRVMPGARIICGGPEFLGDNRDTLVREPWLDCVARGDGEPTFPRFLNALEQDLPWYDIPGLCWIDGNGCYHDNGCAKEPAPFHDVPSPVTDPFHDASKPFVQLETARGCTGTCSYCTSAVSRGVSEASPERVAGDLQALRRRGVRNVRILDRTFNRNGRRCVELLKLFRDCFADMRFHLEIHPGHLSQSVKAALLTMPPGQIHMDVGLQTTQTEALNAVRRGGGSDNAWDGLTFLCGARNLGIHVDLLAGLPGLGMQTIYDDVAALAALGPDEIQLEILKVLPGTPLRETAKTEGLAFAPDPPYEVLTTPAMTVADLNEARLLSRMIDQYYNAAKIRPVTALCVARHGTEFLRAFHAHLQAHGHCEHSISLRNRFGILAEYLASRCWDDLVHALQYEWLRHGLTPRDRFGPAEHDTHGLPSDAVRIAGPGRDPTGARGSQLWKAPIGDSVYWFEYDDPTGGQPAARIFQSENGRAPMSAHG